MIYSSNKTTESSKMPRTSWRFVLLAILLLAFSESTDAGATTSPTACPSATKQLSVPNTIPPNCTDTSANNIFCYISWAGQGKFTGTDSTLNDTVAMMCYTPNMEQLKRHGNVTAREHIKNAARPSPTVSNRVFVRIIFSLIALASHGHTAVATVHRRVI